MGQLQHDHHADHASDGAARAYDAPDIGPRDFFLSIMRHRRWLLLSLRMEAAAKVIAYVEAPAAPLAAAADTIAVGRRQ